MEMIGRKRKYSKWTNKVAIVTGANKGIGYATVRELCLRGVGVVYLTARDEFRGRAAVETLKEEGLEPEFHQLDITDAESVKKLAENIKANHRRIDILINNAGVTVNSYLEADYEDSKRVINVNYRSLHIIQEFLYPILNSNARVVNISAAGGHISNIANPGWIKRLTSEDVKRSDVDEFVDWFLDCVKTGSLNEEDFPVIHSDFHSSVRSLLAYRISKVAVSALTRVHQKDIGRGISIHSMYPGFVQTDMTGWAAATISAEQSAALVAYVALDVDQNAEGKYFWGNWTGVTEVDWADTSLYSPLCAVGGSISAIYEGCS